MLVTARWCVLTVAAVASLETRGLAAERRASLTATGGVSVAVNPFLSTNDVVKTLLAELTLHPVLTSKTAISTVELSATLGYRRYSGNYGSSLFGDGVVSGSIQKSARLQLTGAAYYRHEISSDIVNEAALGANPNSIRQSLGGSASATLRTSEYNVVAPSFSVQRVSYSGDNDLTAYDSVSGGLGFSRRLSPYTSAGVRGGAQYFVPHNGSVSSALSASATVDHKFTSTIQLDGALGLQRVSKGNRGVAGDSGSGGKIFLAANANVCKRGQWSNLCLTGAIASEPSGLGQLERRISAGISYAHRLSEYSSLLVAANYQRSSGLSADGGAALQYLQARASFDRKLNKALAIGTYITYRRRAGFRVAEGGSAGINLRWMTGRN